ncbi:uncharacterized protein EV422DRAFT_506824 [Fimicolochytrium jonesii]|uniref:uncharacterized protein n=1 Tax=Fimicolochytrium jonesii TaxID=1396493 RepID=UPI0022FDCBD6|nr:uncharacterized protein EV422DRAFT_506824 [Fimicolochytrium jonesii]KAI8820083.1 hypothetical protein EV422DRAFT_506824 [Fimicolochytrium jonesii]
MRGAGLCRRAVFRRPSLSPSSRRLAPYQRISCARLTGATTAKRQVVPGDSRAYWRGITLPKTDVAPVEGRGQEGAVNASDGNRPIVGQEDAGGRLDEGSPSEPKHIHSGTSAEKKGSHNVTAAAYPPERADISPGNLSPSHSNESLQGSEEALAVMRSDEGSSSKPSHSVSSADNNVFDNVTAEATREGADTSAADITGSSSNEALLPSREILPDDKAAESSAEIAADIAGTAVNQVSVGPSDATENGESRQELVGGSKDTWADDTGMLTYPQSSEATATVADEAAKCTTGEAPKESIAKANSLNLLNRFRYELNTARLRRHHSTDLWSSFQALIPGKEYKLLAVPEFEWLLNRIRQDLGFKQLSLAERKESMTAVWNCYCKARFNPNLRLWNKFAKIFATYGMAEHLEKVYTYASNSGITFPEMTVRINYMRCHAKNGDFEKAADMFREIRQTRSFADIEQATDGYFRACVDNQNEEEMLRALEELREGAFPLETAYYHIIRFFALRDGIEGMERWIGLYREVMQKQPGPKITDFVLHIYKSAGLTEKAEYWEGEVRKTTEVLSQRANRTSLGGERLAGAVDVGHARPDASADASVPAQADDRSSSAGQPPAAAVPSHVTHAHRLADASVPGEPDTRSPSGRQPVAPRKDTTNPGPQRVPKIVATMSEISELKRLEAEIMQKRDFLLTTTELRTLFQKAHLPVHRSTFTMLIKRFKDSHNGQAAEAVLRWYVNSGLPVAEEQEYSAVLTAYMHANDLANVRRFYQLTLAEGKALHPDVQLGLMTLHKAAGSHRDALDVLRKSRIAKMDKGQVAGTYTFLRRKYGPHDDFVKEFARAMEPGYTPPDLERSDDMGVAGVSDAVPATKEPTHAAGNTEDGRHDAPKPKGPRVDPNDYVMRLGQRKSARARRAEKGKGLGASSPSPSTDITGISSVWPLDSLHDETATRPADVSATASVAQSHEIKHDETATSAASSDVNTDGPVDNGLGSESTSTQPRPQDTIQRSQDAETQETPSEAVPQDDTLSNNPTKQRTDLPVAEFPDPISSTSFLAQFASQSSGGKQLEAAIAPSSHTDWTQAQDLSEQSVETPELGKSEIDRVGKL